MLLKIEGSRLSFARSFATDELPSEEVDPNAAVVIDEKEASKMRTRIIPVEVSMRYLKSKGKFSTEVIKYVINNKEICLKVIQLHMALKQSGWNIGEILKDSLHLKQEKLALYIFFLSKYHPIFFYWSIFYLQRKDKITTGNPCPICRDEYLVLDYRNVELLKQFISPFNGAILPTK